MNDNKAFLIKLISKYNEVDLGIAEDMLKASIYRDAEYLNLAAKKAIEEVIIDVEAEKITEEKIEEFTEGEVSLEIEQPTIEKVEDESAE